MAKRRFSQAHEPDPMDKLLLDINTAEICRTAKETGKKAGDLIIEAVRQGIRSHQKEIDEHFKA